MALFSWKDSYSVNIREIDEQHKQLIEMINRLHEAMAERKGKTVLGGLFAELIAYTKTHFDREERLMQEYDYPAYESHKEKHEKMTAKVLLLQEDFKKGNITITLDVSKFLKDWLEKHILGTDMLYSGFMNSKGVE